MFYKTRGPKKEPQKTSDRTCLRKFAMKVLEIYDSATAEEIFQKALAELERLAEDPGVHKPMAIFMGMVKNKEFEP